ncbi:phosphatidylethanolamine N-methyltransferase isoform X2 [Lemur catta]|uniref:phosphatidylethanolamine N-methyltransferase isoform X2 n=1 Tax=Lemur catta TaxID=9447 RepID=UPI001E268514|nr:phosphatidylethanolamine N-methyltransferase isoform X2 [Lemur catta]
MSFQRLWLGCCRHGHAGFLQSSVLAAEADLCVMTWLLGYVDPSDSSFVAAILAIAFNPLYWNVVARWEHRTRKLSRAFHSPHLACYALGGSILLLNLLRSHCFTQAMLHQPLAEGLDHPAAYGLGLALLGLGSMFVLSSFFALGFTGTFLGDYFGILKEARVTTFPFNILDNPMYWGSTANYLGWAIARQPHGPAADCGSGPHLCGRCPVRGALHHRDLPAESLQALQEKLTGDQALRGAEQGPAAAWGSCPGRAAPVP